MKQNPPKAKHGHLIIQIGRILLDLWYVFIIKSRRHVPDIACTVLAALVFLSVGPDNATAQTSTPPNIIFILIDDLGWTDINCHESGCTGREDLCTCSASGNEYDSQIIQTPHIQQLREAGMRFTSAYAYPTCTPTRVSLMTGKSSSRLSILTAWDTTPLSLGEVTIPEALDAGGIDYVSASIGKWNIVSTGQAPDQDTDHPELQGFDYNWAGSYINIPPTHFQRNGWNQNIFPNLDPYNPGDPCEYLADRLTDYAITFINEREANSEPYFLYLPYYAVHEPWEAKTEDIDAAQNWDPNLTGNQLKYFAMIHNLDQNIGRVIESVDESNNTVIFFMSDNGALESVTSDGLLRGEKSTIFEGGIRVPLIVKWPGVIEPNSTCDIPVHCTDIFPTILEMVYPETFDSFHYPAVDGESMLPLMKGQENQFTRDAGGLFWALLHTAAMRVDSKKLIKSVQYVGQDEIVSYDLYNLDNDLRETTKITDDPNFDNYINSLENWLDSFKPYMMIDNEPVTYNTIYEALNAADDPCAFDEEAIILPPAVFESNYDNPWCSLFLNDNISIISQDPNDPAIVVSTIILDKLDCNGSNVMVLDPDWGGSITGVTISRRTVHETYLDFIIPGNGINGNSNANGTVSKCVIRDFYGNGIINFNGTISNCVIANNTAEGDGGGVMESDANIVSCAILKNKATSNGGGLFDCNGSINNCIIWGNKPDPLVFCSIPTYSCVEKGSIGLGCIASDPLFVDADTGDYHLRWNSPCINRGDPAYVAGSGDTDMDGQPRVTYSRVDIGPDEVFPLAGDIDRDLEVDTEDLNAIISHWLETGCEYDGGDESEWCHLTDINQDGIVNLIDLSYLTAFWLVGIP
ncbi:MAG: sulfatase-like hydrolase/transferase [Sedimentisphaerales bacterium]|nr:sulfatase-like hydrolase/transferase [Sedimentisphaerales bacterium]